MVVVAAAAAAVVVAAAEVVAVGLVSVAFAFGGEGALMYPRQLD